VNPVKIPSEFCTGDYQVDPKFRPTI